MGHGVGMERIKGKYNFIIISNNRKQDLKLLVVVVCHRERVVSDEEEVKCILSVLSYVVFKKSFRGKLL